MAFRWPLERNLLGFALFVFFTEFRRLFDLDRIFRVRYWISMARLHAPMTQARDESRLVERADNQRCMQISERLVCVCVCVGRCVSACVCVCVSMYANFETTLDACACVCVCVCE